MAPTGSILLTCWMSLIALFMASTAQASRSPRFLSAFQHAINISDYPGSQMTRIDLLHRDHPLSPLAPAEGTSFSERLGAAAKRSQGRHLSRWRGRGLSAFSTPVELKGGVGGEYVISIFFGTPPQQFTGLVDTGSDLVWIQCGPCISCFSNHPNPVFDPSASSSEIYVPCSDPNLCNPDNLPVFCAANTNNCQIEYRYKDGSHITGVLTTESMGLTNTAGPAPTSASFLMGCMNNNTGIFDNYDGIIGFGRGAATLPSQFAALGDQNVFALCLVPYTATTTLASALLFGTRDATNTLGLVYTPLLPVATSNTYYWVDMVGVSVGGVNLGIPLVAFQADPASRGGGVIFDSGTPYTYFAPAIYDPIQQSIAGLIMYPIAPDASNRFCFDTAGVTNPSVPSMTFHFAGIDARSVVDFPLEAQNVYVPQSTAAGNTVFCLAFKSDNSGGSMILGSIAMANHYMEHDVVNMRLGFVSKDCTL